MFDPVEVRAARAEGGNKGFLLAGAVAAFAAFLPFVRLFLGGQSLYFRDLASHFLPLRRFLLEGIAGGEWRFWNPFVHEGEPLLLSPFAYLPDLFQLLLPNESGISLFLALHLPFAAVSFVLLARELELGPIAAAAGGLIYALGGFSLSTVNLYIYTQTIAWAPLFILTFRRALDRRGGRAIVLAAGALAMMISTTGMEIALQACLLAVIIAPPLDRRRFGRASASAVLGLGLGGAVILPVLSLTGSSARGAGFPTSTVLTYSIHPVSLVQTFIAGLFGDTANLTGAWWGWNFFAQGFPYILSLYLGPVVLCLAALALTLDRPLGRRLALAACAFGFIGLGAHAGWAVFFDLSPSFRFLRYPVKAFFAVQFSIAMLASFALEAIASGGGGLVLRRLLRICFGFGLALAGAPLLTLQAPTLTGRLLDGLLPASLVPVQREVVARLVTADAAAGGVAAVAVALVAWLALRGRLPLRPATAAIVALIAADLIRAGAGLNAGVTRDFYRLSPEMAGEVSRMRDVAARVITCDPEASPAYWGGRRLRGEPRSWDLRERWRGARSNRRDRESARVHRGCRTLRMPTSACGTRVPGNPCAIRTRSRRRHVRGGGR